jgi:hypothetical protein
MACRPFRSGSALLAFARAEASLFEKEKSQAKHGWKQGCLTDMATKGKMVRLRVRAKLAPQDAGLVRSSCL